MALSDYTALTAALTQAGDLSDLLQDIIGLTMPEIEVMSGLASQLMERDLIILREKLTLLVEATSRNGLIPA